LEQGGVVRGWMLRERRDLGVQGIVFVDHWWYTDGYAFLAGPGDEVTVVPDGTWDSIPEFSDHISLVVDPLDPLDHYQRGEYSYVALDNL
jgi:hypothetical protein